MTIVLEKSEFLSSLFPGLKEVDWSDDKELQKQLQVIYSFQGYTPEIEIGPSTVTISVDPDEIENVSNSYDRIVALASKGQYPEAKKLLLPIVEKGTRNSDIHRIYGQILSDEGKVEESINALIEALKWDPKNKWALIMMGNVYARQKKDVDTALIYYNQAVAVDPKDNIALNNIGGLLLQEEHFDQGLEYLQKALAIDPDYPNTYLGLAMGYHRLGDYAEAFDFAIRGLRQAGKDAQILQMLQRIAVESAQQLVEENDGMRIVEGYAAGLETKSKKGIEILEDASVPYAAKLEVAENYQRDVHRVKYKPSYPAIAHLVAHELVHLDLILQARAVGENELFVSSPAHKTKFISRLGKYLNKLKKKGIPEKNIANVVNQLFDGLNSQIYNTPIDLFIEDFIYNEFPKLRPHQFLSLLNMIQEGITAVTRKDIVDFANPWVLEKSRTYNIIGAMGFRRLYGLDLVPFHEPKKQTLRIAEKAFGEFLEYLEDKGPAEEYDLVVNWAEDIGVSGYFKLVDENTFRKAQADPIVEVKDEEIEDYESNISKEEREKSMKTFLEEHGDEKLNMAVVMHMVDAIQYFAKLPKAKTKEIAFQIAKIGMNGIHPEKDGYHVPLIPGSSFSGYQMLAYYYVSWAKAMPEMLDQLQMPFDQEYELAQKFLKQ